MYQQNVNFNLDYLDNPKKEFEKFVELALDFLSLNKENFQEDTTEYDLSKKYLVNWACAWNKTTKVGKQCEIVQKNNKFALVCFTDDQEVNLDKFYRLEDLSKID